MNIFKLPLNFSLFFITFVCFALGFLSLGASQVRAERSLQQVFDEYFGAGIIDTTDETGKMTFPAGKYEITLIAKEAGATFAPNGWYPLSNSNQLNQIFPGETTPLTTVEVNIPADYGLWIQTIFGLWKSQPSLNFDGVDHFRVFDIPGGGFAVGIEDLAGGGDWDFQDHVLAFVIKEKVPYFNQTDLPWGPQEYDHADSIGPFKCGRTVAQCGCAITSAAMLLKYYGADTTPDGLPINPATLNNWLKNNKGYINGALDWLAIARYSKISHDKFGTQIIDYLGPVRSTNFTLLNSDLLASRPVILEELSVVGLHFIVATGILDTTHAINDPISINNSTLNAYGNSFRAMRRYAPANTDLSGLIIATDAPNEFLIIDQQGRRTGQDPTTGNLYSEIPNAAYYFQEPLANDEESAELLPQDTGHIFFESVDTESGEYTVLTSGNSTTKIIFRAYDHDAGVSEETFTSTGPAKYVLDYSPELGSQIQVTQIVDVDVKPGSDPNSINLSAKGLIPVAILTTSGFDATQVDVATVRFGPNQVKEIHNKGHLEDVDSDGDIDLVLHFNTQGTGIQNIDTQACLTGATLNGVPIQGCDSVRVVGK